MEKTSNQNNAKVKNISAFDRAKPLPRMRTIPKAAEEVGVAVFLVRKLVKEEKIIFVKSGCKSYVNLDSLINYLNTGDCTVKTN